MSYLYLKAIHIIFVITWFAGLFYIVRLFIYHREAQEKGQNARTILSRQYEIMERRLWNMITVPSMLLTVASGVTLLFVRSLLDQPWMWVKMAFLAGLLAYHFYCGRILGQMAEGKFHWTSQRLRLWNEVATVFLFAIVFLAVVKHALSWAWGMLGLVILTAFLIGGIRMYRLHRTKKDSTTSTF